MKMTGFILGSLLLMGVAVAADEGHQSHGEHAGHTMAQQEPGVMGGMFMETREVDGYQVNFHVMPAPEGMHHGGSHNLMVKIEQDGRVLEDVQINSKVIFPDRSDQQQRLQRMGDWYMVGYDMQGDKRHQVMVLFRTVDGKNHRAGVYYPK